MKAVILAAGKGERLRPLTQALPKPLIRLNGVPIIDYSISCLIRLERIEEVVVVAGYRGEQLAQHLESCYSGLRDKVICLKNDEYDKGSLLSLLKAKERLLEVPFLLTNADHIFPLRLWDRLLSRSKGRALALAIERGRKAQEDEMKVVLRGGRVVKIGKGLKRYDGIYIGICICDGSYGRRLLEKAELEVKKGNVEATPEEVYALMASEEGLDWIDCSGHSWFEVDTQEDLVRAEEGVRSSLEAFLPQPGG